MQITPEQQQLAAVLRQQQSQGAAAQNQLQGFNSTPQAQMAFGRANQALPQVTGEGYSARMPNIFETLGAFSNRLRGSNELDAMKAQADTLRGTAERGVEAGLLAKDLNQQRAFDQNAKMAEEARAASNAKVTGSPSVWVNDAGQQVEFVNTGYGPVDPITKEPVDLKGFKPIVQDRASLGGGSLGRTNEKNAANAFGRIRTAQGIKQTAEKLTNEDIASMNTPALSVAVKMATPAAWDAYIQNNQRNFSPQVKQLMTKLSMLGAEQIHELYGAALTELENKRALGFAVGSEGLMFKDALGRVDSLYDSAVDTLGGIQDATGRNLLDHDTVTSYKYGYGDSKRKASSGAGENQKDNFNVELKAATDMIKRLEGELSQ